MKKEETIKMYRTGTVLSILGVTKPSLRRLMLSGELPFYAVGGRYRFSVEDIEKYLAENKNKPFRDVKNGYQRNPNQTEKN